MNENLKIPQEGRFWSTRWIISAFMSEWIEADSPSFDFKLCNDMKGFYANGQRRQANHLFKNNAMKCLLNSLISVCSIYFFQQIIFTFSCLWYYKQKPNRMNVQAGTVYIVFSFLLLPLCTND